jgi:hypothetical protein
MPSIRSLIMAVTAACVLAGGRAAAQDPDTWPTPAVQLAPFAGLQFGGSFVSASGRQVSLGADLDYGGTLDIRFAGSWSVEALYSRQETDLEGFEATVERMMAGLVEEQGDGRTRLFGVAMLGATRFVPGLSAYGSSTHFTVGLGLGLKHFFSGHFGVRAEARGFYVITEAGGGVFCSGGCLFTFNGSGLSQGEVAAGLVLGF